jgi:hypothetical protein
MAREGKCGKKSTNSLGALFLIQQKTVSNKKAHKNEVINDLKIKNTKARGAQIELHAPNPTKSLSKERLQNNRNIFINILSVKKKEKNNVN